MDYLIFLIIFTVLGFYAGYVANRDSVKESLEKVTSLPRNIHTFVSDIRPSGKVIKPQGMKKPLDGITTDDTLL